MTSGGLYAFLGIVVAFATLVLAAIGVWGGGVGREIRLLKDRVADIEQKLAKCEQERETLLRENLELMRRYVAILGKEHP